MLYLIGGGARCGKTTLAKKILVQKPGAAYLSGDSFRSALKPVLPAFHTSGVDASNPVAYITYYKVHTEQAIEETIKRAEALWPFIERYLTAYKHESDGDLIIESVDIWPQFIHRLPMPHKAMFMIDTDAAQWKRVTSHLGENDWLTAKGLTPEQIEAWASYNAPRGNQISTLCKKYGYDYKDLATLGFATAQEEAIRELLA